MRLRIGCLLLVVGRVYSVGCDCAGAAGVSADAGGMPDASGGPDAGTGDAGSPDGGGADAGALDAGPIEFVQGNLGSFNGLTGALAFNAPVRPGDLLLVMVAFAPDAGAVSSVTDSLGNAFTLAIVGGDHDVHSLFFASGADAGSDTISVTLTQPPAGTSLQILEYGGILPTGAIDQTSDLTGTGLAASGSLTTRFPNELVYVFCGSPNASIVDAGLGWALRPPPQGSLSGDQVAPIAGTSSESFTTGSPTAFWDVVMASFRGN